MGDNLVNLMFQKNITAQEQITKIVQTLSNRL